MNLIGIYLLSRSENNKFTFLMLQKLEQPLIKTKNPMIIISPDIAG
jgi:hypothetical protein